MRDKNGKILHSISVQQDITEHRQTEKEKEKYYYNLNERIKELNCLYSITNLIDTPKNSLKEIFKGVVNLIPPSWQYPEITCSRILFDNQEFATNNFKNTIWKQTEHIKVYGKRKGTLEICYLEKKPDSFKDPFLKEERLLIKAIVTRLGNAVEQAEAEVLLRESEEKYRLLVENANEAISVLDYEGKYLFVNKSVAQLFGLPAHDIIGKTMWDFLTKEFVSGRIATIRKICKSGQGHTSETNVQVKGKTLWFQSSTQPIRDKSGRITSVLNISTDITERKQIEKKIFNTIIETEEKERNRLAENLHDDLGPLLSGIKIYIDLIQSGKIEKSEKQKMLEYLYELIDDAISLTKEIANNIMPSTLYDFGLVESIKSFSNKLNYTKIINFSFNETNFNERLEKNVEIILYRAIKELINNSLKHAYAKNIEINFSKNNGLLTLIYKDNGIGFDVTKILSGKNATGMGLNNIISRLKSIDGNIDLNSNPGNGMTAKIEVRL